jgi:hypothetical protein
MKAKLINRGNGNYRLYIDEIPYATTDNSPYKKLSKQNCDEIFGVVDVVDLAERNSKYSEEDYIEGFNKAMELNREKVFTLEDMRKAFELGHDGAADTYMLEKKMQEFEVLIQQPTEIEVMIEMEDDKDTLVDNVEQFLKELGDKPKLDSSGRLILKRVV